MDVPLVIDRHPPGSLVLLVGPDSSLRTGTSRALIEHGMQVVLCSGPPGCRLTVDDHCVLLEQAAVVAILPGVPPEGLAELEVCADAAKTMIVVGKDHDPFKRMAYHVTSDPQAVAQAAEAAIAAEGTAVGRKDVR